MARWFETAEHVVAIPRICRTFRRDEVAPPPSTMCPRSAFLYRVSMATSLICSSRRTAGSGIGCSRSSPRAKLGRSIPTVGNPMLICGARIARRFIGDGSRLGSFRISEKSPSTGLGEPRIVAWPWPSDRPRGPALAGQGARDIGHELSRRWAADHTRGNVMISAPRSAGRAHAGGLHAWSSRRSCCASHAAPIGPSG